MQTFSIREVRSGDAPEREYHEWKRVGWWKEHQAETLPGEFWDEIANGQRHPPGSVCHEGRMRMPATKLVFSLQDLHHGWWQAVLSDGLQEAIITASAIPEEPLLPLLWAVRLLLLGANASQCIWWGEPGQYRWLFSRTEQQVQIHIVWFADHQQWSDDKGKTMLCLECNLLAFAKRFSHQLSQLEYQNGSPVVAPQEYQHLKDALLTYEQKQPDSNP